MNYLFSIFSILLITVTKAQDYTTTTLNNVVYSMDYTGAKQKVNYFIPFMYNKEMRGLSANISLSVVF
jgi:hypothetical protein